MTGIVTAYLRQPLQSLAERENTRLDTVGEMVEQLRRLAWRKLGKIGRRPVVSAQIGADGWIVNVRYGENPPIKTFNEDTLSEAHAKAMAWAIDTKAETV